MIEKGPVLHLESWSPQAILHERKGRRAQTSTEKAQGDELTPTLAMECGAAAGREEEKPETQHKATRIAQEIWISRG